MGSGRARLQIDSVARTDVRGNVAVYFHSEAAARRQDLEGEAVADGYYQPAVVGRMGRGGGDKKRLDRRVNDRAAGGEAVGRGASRGGHHDRVGGVADELVACGPYRHESGRLTRKADDGDVIEGSDHLVANHRIDRQPRLNRELVTVDSRQRRGQVRDVYLGQETELAEIDAQHRGALAV